MNVYLVLFGQQGRYVVTSGSLGHAVDLAEAETGATATAAQVQCSATNVITDGELPRLIDHHAH